MCMYRFLNRSKRSILHRGKNWTWKEKFIYRIYWFLIEPITFDSDSFSDFILWTENIYDLFVLNKNEREMLCVRDHE